MNNMIKKMSKIADPVFGYVEIEKEILEQVVDTAAFQRIRRTIHASYSPVYPSGVHNRFAHSLGVYYLGTMVSRQLMKEIRTKSRLQAVNKAVKNQIEGICRAFELACLLHDVGHAPFSHTGEDFFLGDENKKGYPGIFKELCEAIEKVEGTPVADLRNHSSDADYIKKAKPHEIMSAIIGIREFSGIIGDEKECEFFARCITGYAYDITSGEEKEIEKQIRNGFISLLNGKVIDVDKLDYLLRDEYMQGFATVTLDYRILLENLTFAKVDGYQIAYYKQAIPVIENIVYAGDSEKKWLQGNPVSKYDTYLLQQMIRKLLAVVDPAQDSLFTSDALSEDGKELQFGPAGTQKIWVRLLSDDDLISMFKSYLNYTDCVKEYFDRSSRSWPLWMSEAEFKAYFTDIAKDHPARDQVIAALENTAKYLKTNGVKISKDTLAQIDQQLIDHNQDTTDFGSPSEIRKVMQGVLDYVEGKLGFNCEMTILSANPFTIGYKKSDFADINIAFYRGNKIFVKKVTEVMAGFEQEKDKKTEEVFFFYLKPNKDEKYCDIDNAGLLQAIFSQW